MGQAGDHRQVRLDGLTAPSSAGFTTLSARNRRQALIRSGRHFISAPQEYEVALVAEPETDELSRAEEALIEEVFGKFGNMSRWDLVRISHELPEWQDPNGSAIPIQYRDILRAGNKTESEIAAVEAELESLATAEAMLQPA